MRTAGAGVWGTALRGDPGRGEGGPEGEAAGRVEADLPEVGEDRAEAGQVEAGRVLEAAGQAEADQAAGEGRVLEAAGRGGLSAAGRKGEPMLFDIKQKQRDFTSGCPDSLHSVLLAKRAHLFLKCELRKIKLRRKPKASSPAAATATGSPPQTSPTGDRR